MKKYFNLDTIIKYSLILLIIFLPLRELLSLHIGNNIKLISDAIIFTMLISTIISKKIKLKIKKQDIFFILFLIIGTISTVINKYNIYTILIQIRSISIYYLLYFILRNYKFKNNQINLITKTLKIITITLFSLSLIEIIFNKMILFPNTWATNIQYADNYLRTYGLFNNPNSYAVFTLMTYIFLNKYDNKNNYIINTMLISIILLTMSRSTLIFLIIYLIYSLVTNNKTIKEKLKNIIIPLLLSILITLSTTYIKDIIDYKNIRQNTYDDAIQEELDEKYKETETSDNIVDRVEEITSDRVIASSKYNGRLYSITKGIEIFTDYPIIGTGFGSYGSSASMITTSKIYDKYEINDNFYADNDYIKVLVETGIIGFIIYGLLCISILKNNKKEWLLCLIFFGYGLFLNNFETQSLTLLFFLMLSLNQNHKKIEKNKLTIYALHLNYGGVEKSICTKANMLSNLYNVEIVSLYKLTDKPVFNLNKNIKVKYLTSNIKPNREEFKNAIKSKNIIKIIKEGLYSIKVLYLKDTLLTKSFVNCNSEIIISTRIDFTEKLLKNNEYNNIKIAEEHIYHNNKDKYLNKLYKILKNIDYLMPSSDYLTNYYKELFTKYRYKIITNIMPIETDNTISNLKNKNIITVGRLSIEKGYNDLIKLFSKINNDEWQLFIVGDGPEYNNLNNLIKELNIEDKVKLLGSKTTEELNELYKNSSIYIMTSLEESFGLVLIEASSHGLPIIAYSSALGAKEILKDKGILIDNRNESIMISKLNELMNDIKLRNVYQSKSLTIIEEHNNKVTNSINFYKTIKKNDIYANLYCDEKKTLYKLVEKKLKNKEKTFVITANAEQYILSETDKEINDMLYDKNNLIVADGIVIVKTANYLNYNINERITGVELAEYMFELANKNKYKVYLFGASLEVMEKLENVINEKYPDINLVGATNGYVSDKDSVMEYIKTTNPDIVMLALGVPLQEKLINKHINDFKKGIFIGVGGSFDVLSGNKKRAPKIFIKFNLEWLYRISCEPKRIIRFIKYNMKFIIKIFEDKNNR